MKISIKSLAAMGLAATMAATSYIPAQAMPLPAPVVQKATDVEQVQYRRYDRRYDRRHHRDRPGYYHGHRGYRHHRPGYRYHNGFWFPLAAFTAGAIIGGAVAAPPTAPRAAGLNPRHYEWCAARYRSFDARSNTFQPYNGPRRQCYSPYY